MAWPIGRPARSSRLSRTRKAEAGTSESGCCSDAQSVVTKGRRAGAGSRQISIANSGSGLAQVGIGAVEPILSGRIEDVHVERVLERFGRVRQVGWNVQHFARANVQFLCPIGA